MEIKGSTKVTDAFKASKKVADVFRKYGLDCMSCKGVVEETVERAAFNHGISLKEFLKEINKALK